MAVEVVDLTHPISETMPVFPGTKPPAIADAYTIARNGFAEKSLQFVSHTGTHIDAPGHILAGAPRLDRFPAGRFLGRGLVLDVTGVRARPIEVSDLQQYEARLHAVDFALLHTGWAGYWGSDDYFGAYPVLSPAAAHWLSGFALKGVGMDTISADEVDSTALVVHRTLFAAGLLIVENLAGLDVLVGKEFDFSCLPLKIADADGSPIRAVAILESTK
jgi:arylformamidase